MGLISGMVMGMMVGIAMVAGWREMMRYRSSKRISKVIWRPYTEEVLSLLPLYCRGNEYLHAARVPLIHFCIVELHTPDRVLRQFGGIQGVPMACDTSSQLHAIDLRGKSNVDWTEFHAVYIRLWNIRRDYVVSMTPISLGGPDTTAEYLPWYRQITRHFIGRHGCTLDYAAGDIKLLSSLSRDDLRKICGEAFPEWISFPAYEQVKWLNKQLSKMWPFIADAATLVVRETVEPMLEDYRPPGISSLKFSKFSLGTVAPKIEGIRVQSMKKGQITMDIDFRWGGDPSIILAVEALVASLPIQLKDLQVFTIIRVIFQLSEDIPCISAVVVALLAEPKPRIDYTLKAVGGSLTAVPGLSDMIDDTVNSIISDMLQWPHRIVVPIGGVPVDTSDLELKPHGKLSVTVVKATALKNMELIGKSDPYVVLCVRPLFKYKTKVIDDNLNPEWNETFELIAEDKETQSIIFEVFDKDVTKDERLGIVKLPLKGIEPEVSTELELRLLPALDMLKIKDKKDRGTLTIKVFYHTFSKEEQLEALEAEKRIMEERRKLKEAGVLGSTMDALGSGLGHVTSGVGAGVGMVGSGVVAGAGMVGTGIGAGVNMVGSGFGAVGSGLSKAGKFVGKSFTGTFKQKNGSSSPRPGGSNSPKPGASGKGES